MLNDHAIEMIVTIAVSVIASSGFWTYIDHKTSHNSDSKMLLLGLAHTELISIGMEYIDRGYITQEDYDDFVKYLYEPYINLGGDGTAKKIFDSVSALPIGMSKREENHGG